MLGVMKHFVAGHNTSIFLIFLLSFRYFFWFKLSFLVSHFKILSFRFVSRKTLNISFYICVILQCLYLQLAVGFLSFFFYLFFFIYIIISACT